LIISEDALVTGDIHVNHLIVNGQVDGNIYVSGKVELFDKARINGDVHYGLLELPAGAEVNGKLIRIEDQE
jgi:cytoskeletal protein CcmA (bactofilin family)